MTSATHGQETLAELAPELHHADMLVAEQAERIEFLEVEIVRLRVALAKAGGTAA